MINFIVNEKSRSGKGTILWDSIKRVLEKRKIRYRFWITEYKGHAREITSALCRENAEEIKLVVIGGDGTINEVINGITDFDRVCLGVIPTGSGNDFARGAGLADDHKEQLKRILFSRREIRLDLGKVTYGEKGKSKLFAISSGVGMDALVCKKAEKSKVKKILNSIGFGKLTYLIITVQSLFSMNTCNVSVSFDGKEKYFDSLVFLAAMNFKAEGGGVPMAPRADALDGKLSVCTGHSISKWKTFFILPFLVIAKHEKFKYFDVIDCLKCDIRLDNKMTLHTDGEYCGDVTEVKYECVKGKLRLMV